MGFYQDPDQNEDFPHDHDDYESLGYYDLDANGKYVIELFLNEDVTIDTPFIQELIEDLIVDNGLNNLAEQIIENEDYFTPYSQLDREEVRKMPFPSAADAKAYLELIPGWEGFASITWVNGIWHVAIARTSQ